MDIRGRMTATVRLDDQAAERLNDFIRGLKPPPTNINDVLVRPATALACAGCSAYVPTCSC